MGNRECDHHVLQGGYSAVFNFQVIKMVEFVRAHGNPFSFAVGIFILHNFIGGTSVIEQGAERILSFQKNVKERYEIIWNYAKNISSRIFTQFYCLNKCEVTDAAMLVIVYHLQILVHELNYRFFLEFLFSTWLTQPFLMDICEVDIIFKKSLLK